MEDNQSVAIAEQEETTLVDQNQADELAMIDKICRSAQSQIARADAISDNLTKALVTAKATRMLQSLLTDNLMADIMALQSTPLGFRTDRDNARDGQKGYPVAVVRDVVIQALMRGFQVVGNQINIIAGNLYVTKEGFENRLNNFEGLSNIEFDFEVPDLSRSGSALCGCRANWQLHGELCEIDCTKSIKGDYRIPVKINNGMGDDAILGKAKSKLFRRIYERISGQIAPGFADDMTLDADTVQPHDSQPSQEPQQTIEHKPTSEPAQAKPPSAQLEAVPVEAEPLLEAIEADLQIALASIKTREHFAAAREQWKSRAKNREFSLGQRKTIGLLFAVREAKGFTN